MYFNSETALFNACRTLFGKEVNLSYEFLHYLQPSGAKTAFRNQAKAHHPDAHASSSPHIRQQQAERFREIRQAYDLLIDYLEKRPRLRSASYRNRPAQQTAPQRTRKTRQHGARQRAHAKPVSIPSIPLEFGMYSFYQGKVTYQQLIEALVWQRRQRPTLGAIAQQWGWLSEAKIERVLGHRGQALRFGKKAVELGYLKPHQVEALLNYQRTLQKRIGKYFVEQGLLSEEEANQISRNLVKHNRQINLRTKSRFENRR
jgi:curved DNA-binding protein CbpA